jgi:hypothetical protein
MKFGAKLSYFATWLGMLAAGSWIVPLMSVAAAPRVAVAAPMSDNSNDDGWTGSEVAQAWALATGSEYAPATQVLTMQSGADQVPVVVDQVRSDDGSSVGLSWFMTELSLPIAETSNQGAEFSVTARAELVTGRVVGALGHPGFFSGIRVAMSGQMVHLPEGSEQFALLPFAAFQTEADAAAFHESMVEASQGGESGDGGGGGLFCVNPNWRGTNGVECCMFEMAYGDRMKACALDYAAGSKMCAAAALAVACPLTYACMQGCAAVCTTVVLCKLCLAGCGLGGLAVLVLILYNCLSAEQDKREACEARARADYVSDRATNGCPPKPGASMAIPTPDSAKAETLALE